MLICVVYLLSTDVGGSILIKANMICSYLQISCEEALYLFLEHALFKEKNKRFTMRDVVNIYLGWDSSKHKAQSHLFYSRVAQIRQICILPMKSFYYEAII